MKQNVVKNFLVELKDHDKDTYNIVTKARDLVFLCSKNINEEIKYGGILFSKKEKDFGGIFVSKKHVSFEFSNGSDFRDSKKLLEGTGKYRRHLKLHSAEDLENKNLEYYIKQAVSD